MLTSTMARYLCAVFLYLLTSHALSEVYQWTDKSGRTHFGDRPPEKASSENISERLNQINITSDYSSPELMLLHQQNKDAEAKKRREAWQEKQKNSPTQDEKCQKARQHLNTITGPVVFVDEHGNDLKISEETRKQRVKILKDTIRKHCQ